jgi:hypothetical protein
MPSSIAACPIDIVMDDFSSRSRADPATLDLGLAA